jgi:hypothetical protein
MEDTDWRPSACPKCGRLRNADRHPVCENIECRDYGRGGPDRKETRTMKTETKNMRPGQYLWVRPNSAESPLVLIDDPMKLFRGSQFDESVDKLYQIGNEVKFKVNLEPVPNYRLSNEHAKTVRVYSTTFENRD